ncbi:MAG: DNA translocase FtsK 4TM domain-containing protein [Elusimicrobiales bacterium]|nr:DNA translocase FtsK 4TM domain-containing protein [Elusimicrobiales bacterium]
MNYRLYSKKSTKSSGFMDIIYWTISVIFSIWLFWIIINPSQKGLIGNFVFSNLYSFFGNSVYFFPFLFFYGLMRILFKLGKPNKGIISMLFGTILILSFISAIMERSHFSGGWAGYFIDSLMIKLFGNIGSVIFSLGFILIGINIIFEVKWGKVFEKLKNTIQRDWEEWKKARAELNNKIKIIEEKKKSGEKVLSVKPANEVIVKKEEKEIKPPEQPQVSDLVKTEETKKDKKQIEKNESKAQIKNKDFLDFKNFKLPDINLLEKNTKSNVYLPDNSEIQSAKIKLEETLKNFEISAYISGIYPGPVITRYEITPSPGVKISSIVSLSNDIALAMRSIGSIRVIAPIPGKSAIGFEIPNSKRSMVTLREIIESPEFNSSKGNLTFALGRYSEGSVAVANLEDMPHLLVAGATGSGKSVFLRRMIQR